MKKIEKYFAEARTRAQRRKSPWNILLLVFSFSSIGFIAFHLSKFIIYLFQAQRTPFPVIAKGHDIELIFITIPSFITALPWGLMAGNILIWLIPPARKALDKEAQGHKGCSFKESMAVLLKIALAVSLICIPIAIFASSRIKL